MKLYDFVKWSGQKRKIKIVELQNDEEIFHDEVRKIRKGWRVIDVGARVGYYTILAGTSAGEQGKVLSIEPHPRIYEVLKMNINFYGLKNVITVPMAVGTRKGTVNLYEGADPGATNIRNPRPLLNMDRDRIALLLELLRRGDILSVFRRTRVPSLQVPINTLDEIAKEAKVGNINLIKIDVEGAEFDVLQGSKRILQEDKPILLIEVHHTWDWNYLDLFKWLERTGYNLKTERRLNKTLTVATP